MNETMKNVALFASHATIIVAIVGASWSLSGSMATLAAELSQIKDKVDDNAVAIGRLEQRLDQVEEKLEARIDQVEEKLDQLVGQYAEHVRQHPAIAAAIGPESQGS